MFLFLVLGILLGILAVIFALQNIVPVTVIFLAWQLHGSLALVIAVAIVLGLLISILVSVPEVVDNFFVLKGLRKKIEDLEAENARLKNAALSHTGTASPPGPIL